MTDTQSYDQRVACLTASRRHVTSTKRTAVAAALRQLQREDRPITRRAVIARAGVHRNFLYRHPDLAAQIDNAADDRTRTPRTTPDRISHDSLRTELTTAKHRIVALQQQVRTLEHRLGAHGPEPTAALLEQHPLVVELRERLARTEVERTAQDRTIASLRDDIEIMRETNRSLVREYGLRTTDA